MAPLQRHCSALLVLFLLASSWFLVSEAQRGRRRLLSYRRNLHKFAGEEDGSGEEESLGAVTPPKKKATSLEKPTAGKIKTLLVKPKKANSTSSSISGVKKGVGLSAASLLSSKTTGGTVGNKTKAVGPKSPKPSNSTAAKLPLKPIKPAKLNSTTGSKTGLTKSLNSTAKVSKKTGDMLLPKTTNKKNTTQSSSSKTPGTSKSTTPAVTDSKKKTNPQQGNGGDGKGVKKPHGLAKPTQILPWLDDGDYGGPDDLISEFRDLPSKFHSALVPDLHRISTTSKAYLTLANKEFAKTFKPLVGTRYAPSAATAASAFTILLPLLLAALLVRCLRPHLPLQKLLLSVHIYLAAYFATLAITAALTGHEPLRFFHASSPKSYAATQVLQTLGYAMYLLLQLVHVAAGGMLLGAAQLLVGVAVGLHYYTAVFHRAVVGEPPRTNWRVHAVYAVCFAAVCVLARAERQKKAYVGEGGREDGKKS